MMNVKERLTPAYDYAGYLKKQGTPALYSQDGKGGEAIVYGRFFSLQGAGEWHITEYSDEAPDGHPRMAYGLCDLGLGEAELGYVSLGELEEVRFAIIPGIEADLGWTPKPLSEVRSQKGY